VRSRQRGGRRDHCLGDKAAALTDGELGAEARDAALAHLVRCDGCRDDVAGQRRLKARLGELADPVLPAGLLDRLHAMGSLGPYDPGPQVVVVRHRVRLHVPHRPARRDHTRPSGRSLRGVRYAIGGGVSVLALGVSAFALGGGQPTPTLVPSVDSFTVEHASTTGEIPFGSVPPVVTFRPVLVGARP
jgi:anti-sigma factor RsiW